MVRRPSLGPSVAMSAGGIAPIILKKRRQRNESHHPKKKRPGPSVPKAKVAVPTFALDQRVKRLKGCWFVRSSSGTRSMPRSSAPILLIQARILRPKLAAFEGAASSPEPSRESVTATSLAKGSWSTILPLPFSRMPWSAIGDCLSSDDYHWWPVQLEKSVGELAATAKHIKQHNMQLSALAEARIAGPWPMLMAKPESGLLVQVLAVHIPVLTRAGMEFPRPIGILRV